MLAIPRAQLGLATQPALAVGGLFLQQVPTVRPRCHHAPRSRDLKTFCRSLVRLNFGHSSQPLPSRRAESSFLVQEALPSVGLPYTVGVQ